MFENDVRLIDLFDSPKPLEDKIYFNKSVYYKYLDFDQASSCDYYKKSNGWWEQISELGLSEKTTQNKITQHLEYRYKAGNIAIKKVKRLINSYFHNGMLFEVLKEGELIKQGDCNLSNGKMMEIPENFIGKQAKYLDFYRKINTKLITKKDNIG